MPSNVSCLLFVAALAGSNFVLLPAAGGQSMHGDRAAVVGELAVVPPLLGSSQRLLNRDHHSVYYKVPRSARNLACIFSVPV